MVLAQRALLRGHHARQEPLRVLVTALPDVKQPEIIGIAQGLGVLLAQRLRERRLCPLQKRFGLRIAALTTVKRRQVVEADERYAVIFAEHLLGQRRRGLR
jgi:hypothetical protein